MIRRLIFLFNYYLLLLAVFVLEKPLFMLYAAGSDMTYGVADYLAVIYHGMPVDISMTGYIVLIPLLLVIVSIWWQKLPFRRIMIVYNILMAFVLALLFVGDSALYPFWGFKLDASVFFYLKTPKEAMASVSVLMIACGFFIVVLATSAVSLLLNRTIRIEFPKVERRAVGTVAVVLLMVPLSVSIRGGLGESTMNIGKAYFSTDQFLNHSAVNPGFSLLSSLGKTDDYASMYEFFDESRRAELFDGLYVQGDSSTEGLLNTTRPNILIIIMEGFGSVFVDSLGGEPGVSPNLDRLASEGVLFTNCYAGSYRTDRGVVCIMNGYPGLPTMSLMKMPVKSKTLPSLPRKFVENGYNTDFLYGGDINFTNMQSYLWSNGYEHITSGADFSASQRKTGAWGVTDKITFSYLFDMLKNRQDTLWHTAFLTLSSHEPFDVPYNHFEDEICNSFSYTDSCIGALADSLKRLPIWDNLLMILVPDHGFCYPVTGNRHAPRIHKIPMIWTGGVVKEHKVIDEYMAQTDMAATLLEQMDIDHSEFRFSRNVLSKDYVYPFAFYTFNNGLCFIDSTGTSLYDDDSGQLIIDEGTEGSKMRLERGKCILQTLMDDLGSR